ncbi:MAG TPA: NADP-dependent oxidoreductase [Nocardioides sp.]|jgi:NADPH:quinone reductase-like Zn-dependent oxidoreductase|nr:NADP-dependent oxidoreductase [Nocardioides sp.]
MSRQWIASRPGGLEVFELVDVEVPPPGPGEVTLRVRAAGMNPADYKHIAAADPGSDFPRPVGYEVSGELTALGPDTEIASGGGSPGEEVLAYRVRGGWAEVLTVRAADVFAKPPGLAFPEAANLLLAGSTASELLHRAAVGTGDTVLLHGASGAVGVSVLQQAALLGVRVVGTASVQSFEVVRRYGGEPVTYGAGLEERVRAAAPHGVAAALDCIGTEEALAVSLALVAEPDRIITIATPAARVAEAGVRRIAGALPESTAYRDSVRADLIRLAAQGLLEVPVAATYPLEEALDAAEVLQGGHPGGKIALLP